MSKPEKKKVTRASLKSAFQEFVWPRRRLISLGLFLILLNRLSGLVLPASTQPLIDDVIPSADLNRMFLLLGGVMVAVIIQSATSYALTMLMSVEAQHLIATLRADVQKHVLHLPVRVFDNTKSGELVSRIMDDVEGVRNLVGTGLVQLVGGPVTAIVAIVLLVRASPVMTLLALGPLAAFAFVSTKAFQTLRPAFRARGAIRAEVTGRLTEALGGIRVIKGFHAVDKEGEIVPLTEAREVTRKNAQSFTEISDLNNAERFRGSLSGLSVPPEDIARAEHGRRNVAYALSDPIGQMTLAGLPGMSPEKAAKLAKLDLTLEEVYTAKDPAIKKALYENGMPSDTVKNLGDRYGGANSAAAFLKQFVPERGEGDDAEQYPWAHLDIAGTAWGTSTNDMVAHGATGVHVRTLTHLLTEQ